MSPSPAEGEGRLTEEVNPALEWSMSEIPPSSALQDFSSARAGNASLSPSRTGGTSKAGSMSKSTVGKIADLALAEEDTGCSSVGEVVGKTFAFLPEKEPDLATMLDSKGRAVYAQVPFSQSTEFSENFPPTKDTVCSSTVEDFMLILFSVEADSKFAACSEMAAAAALSGFFAEGIAFSPPGDTSSKGLEPEGDLLLLETAWLRDRLKILPMPLPGPLLLFVSIM